MADNEERKALHGRTSQISEVEQKIAQPYCDKKICSRGQWDAESNYPLYTTLLSNVFFRGEKLTGEHRGKVLRLPSTFWRESCNEMWTSDEPYEDFQFRTFRPWKLHNMLINLSVIYNVLTYQTLPLNVKRAIWVR